jgi:predicted small metal-binding protein
MSRKIADCRDFPSDNGCTLTIAGEEDEVIAAAAQHAAAVHGHADNDELRLWLSNNLKDEALAQS